MNAISFPFALGDAVSFNGRVGTVARHKADLLEDGSYRCMLGVRCVEQFEQEGGGTFDQVSLIEVDVETVEVVQAEGVPPELVPTPVVVREVSRDVFRQRFTPQEQFAARERAKTDPVMLAIRDHLDDVAVVHLDHPATQHGVAYMQNVGILTPDRPSEILA
jgi:hypothetical protein